MDAICLDTHPPSSTPGDSLRIFMLGPFECWRGEELIPRREWRTRPTLTLFKLLLEERDRPVTIERLIDNIWPESEPGAARRSLQVAVRTLRLTLEPGLGRGTDSRYIHTEPGAYRFAAAASTIDVDQFLAASQRATAQWRRDKGASITTCAEAISIYRGEYFADDPYLEWAFSTRERLRSRYLDLFDIYSDALAVVGKWDEAARWLEQALDLDPLGEELYRRLMRCHVARGRRSHALAVFEQCRQVLHSELGVEPSGEKLKLRADVANRWAGSSNLHAEIAAGGVTSELRLPFVGRSSELAELLRAVERASNETGVVV